LDDWAGGSTRPLRTAPLGFILRRLWLYFDNQFDRFANTLAREQPGNTSLTRLELENLAQYRMFEKPWYEFHAVQLINWIQDAHSDAVNKKEQINLWSLILLSFSGELGRLVEQYYWRFRFEKAAVTGVGARKAASLGGKVKSEVHKAQQSVWQRRASDILGRNPKLSKLAVANLIKKQLGEARTARHIARYITRPNS
jgi:hypothetical protein